MQRYMGWRVALCLVNLSAAGVTALLLMLLFDSNPSLRRECGLATLALSTLLSLVFALSVWVLPERRVGCVMFFNALLFLLLCVAFLVVGIVVTTERHLTLGLLELGLAAEMLLGVTCCRAYSVRVRDDLDRKDALEISHEQFGLAEW